MTPELWTSRYQNDVAIVASGLVPVRTSNGYPRFLKLSYKPVSLPGLYPDRATMGLAKPAFTAAYEAKVEASWPAIAAELERISAENGGRGLVLLCYEDLSKEWCHRRIFAEWAQRVHGFEVREL